MDPVTAFAAANAAFTGIKKLVAAGREATDVMSQLGAWYGAVTEVVDLDQKKKKPGLFTKLVSPSAEKDALQATVREERIKAMRKEIHEMILYAYGEDTLRGFYRKQREIKEEHRRAVLEQKQARQRLIQNVLIGLVVTALIAGGVALIWWSIILLAP